MIVLAIDTATLTASCAVVKAGGEAAALRAMSGRAAVFRGPAGGALAVLAVEDAATSTHSEKILPLIDRVVSAAGIAARAVDAVAIGAGPGSFTGLRIGMATAKGLAFAAGRPLWAVSSLAALAVDLADADGALAGHRAQPAAAAAGAFDAPLYVPVLDARRGELYAGFYRRAGDGVVAVAAEQVMPPEQLAAAIASAGAGPCVVGGDALAVHGAALASLPPDVVRLTAARTTPSAVAVARLALAGDRHDVLARGAPVYIRPSEAEVKYPDGVPGALRRR